MNRREMIAAAGATFGSALLTACDSTGPARAAGALTFAQHKNETLERALFSHRSRDRVAPGVGVAGDKFPSYFISDRVPIWDAAMRGAWRLEVGGMVSRPMAFSLDDLMRLERQTQRVNHYCVEGWTAVADFTGVPVSALAAACGVDPASRFVDFESFDDGYHESWDIESAMHPQTIIVYGKDGSPLSAAYGAPARVHSPVKYGYKNTKYLTRVMFLPAANGGYWSDRGYEWYGGL
ncbi:MAG: molybdopterin-binding protein [Gemmatimonadetes bacterium]|nr:molybdopterin-binding protein [Gemmatimonadota bacterium]